VADATLINCSQIQKRRFLLTITLDFSTNLKRTLNSKRKNGDYSSKRIQRNL